MMTLKNTDRRVRCVATGQLGTVIEIDHHGWVTVAWDSMPGVPTAIYGAYTRGVIVEVSS